MTGDCPDWQASALRRRLALTLVVFSQTALAVWLLARVLPDAGTLAGICIVTLFAVLQLWIAVGFWTAFAGFVLRLTGGDPLSPARRLPETTLANTPLAPTAVVMPIYHEPVQRTLAGLKAIYQDLEASGHLHHFEFYILSDSRDPEVWLAEQAGWKALCRELGSDRIFYRRRTVNLNYKSGNIADFLRRWGRSYRYMVVLDADSLIAGDCVTRLVRMMEHLPRAGIVQTAPRLARATTRFARLQQFASHTYGPLYTRGLAAFQLGDAAYWGHNAILRVAPFMAHCGLRKLKGPGLFGGPVISHDFVEAAYLGRAGWETWLVPELTGSFEESPPSLEDDLARDRRWCRGNLQHLWILLRAPGLRFAHRLALLTGVMSYLASPLWLSFLTLSALVALRPAVVAGLGEAGHAGAVPATVLVMVTLLMLFGPRLLALGEVALSGQAAAFGGVRRLLTGAGLETLVSLLLAPVRMVAHSRFVIAAVANSSLAWAGQNRTRLTSWRRSLAAHGPGMLAGATAVTLGAVAGASLWLWTLPVTLPLILAPVVSVLLSRDTPPSGLATPFDTGAPAVIQRACANTEAGSSRNALSWFQRTVLFPAMSLGQARLSRHDALGLKQRTLETLVRRCAHSGPDTLNLREQSLICDHGEALMQLHERAWQAPPDSYWGRLLTHELPRELGRAGVRLPVHEDVSGGTLVERGLRTG
ncbi:MAG: glucans biosynthesis glucosyltransferase MdoH [Pseudomonadota bacterium]